MGCPLALTADSTLGQLRYIRFAGVLACRFHHSVFLLFSLSRSLVFEGTSPVLPP